MDWIVNHKIVNHKKYKKIAWLTYRDFLPDRIRTTEHKRGKYSADSDSSLRTGFFLAEGEFDWTWYQKV